MSTPLILCPFNKDHRVSRSKLIKHIKECEKIYCDYKACPYSSDHKVLEREFQDHLKICNAKGSVFLVQETFLKPSIHGLEPYIITYEKEFFNLKTCPYNSAHKYPEDIIHKHTKHCTSKILCLYDSTTLDDSENDYPDFDDQDDSPQSSREPLDNYQSNLGKAGISGTHLEKDVAVYDNDQEEEVWD